MTGTGHFLACEKEKGIVVIRVMWLNHRAKKASRDLFGVLWVSIWGEGSGNKMADDNRGWGGTAAD